MRRGVLFARSAAPDAIERYWWLRMVMPSLTMVGALIGLAAWSVVEPGEAQRIASAARWAAIPLSFVFARALVRSFVALANTPPEALAATVGILRPRVIISNRLRARLDASALAAALRHEEAHARHRDPLRIWIAQLAADIRWPLRSARAAFEEWREALEIARDDEALSMGTRGADLAAAILAAATLRRDAAPAVASLLGSDTRLTVRVRRLLAVSTPPVRMASGSVRLMFVIVLTLAISVASGAFLGDFVAERLLS